MRRCLVKRIFAKQNPDNPALVDFYVDGQRVENMYCQVGVRSGGKLVEATARVVAPLGTGTEEGAIDDEDNPATEKGIRVQAEREPGPASDGAGEDDLPATKRHRKKAVEQD
jgi:hypothetical protein